MGSSSFSGADGFSGNAHLQSIVRQKKGEITELKRRLKQVESERGINCLEVFLYL